MGLFHRLIERVRRRRERRTIASRFESYVDPALVIEHPEAAKSPPRHGKIEFVLMIAADSDLARLSESLSEAIEVFRETRAYVEFVSGSLVFATFGVFPPNDPPDVHLHRQKAVTQLSERLASRVRIVHGSGVALIGNIPISSHWHHHGSALPNFGEYLSILVTLNPGGVREVARSPA